MLAALISVLIVALVLGLVVWLLTAYAPLPEPFGTVVRVVAALALLLYALRAFAIL